MAIVPVSKITLYGIADQKEAVLDGLQNLGCTHLVNLTPGAGEGRPVPGYSVEAHKVLQYLHCCPNQRKQAKNPEDFDFAAVEREALAIHRREQELEDERDFVLKAKEALKPWGDFRVPSQEECGGLRFWFYRVPRRRMDAVREADLVWQVVGRDERFQYVVVVEAEEPQGMPVSPEELDPRPLSELTQRVKEIDLELESLHWRRVEQTRWCRMFSQAMAEADDLAVLKHAGLQTLDDSGVFAVQGWAPTEAVPEIEEFAKRRGLALAVAEPGPDDAPPTLLSNPEVLAGGEGAVTLYMTPGYRTWDPSLVVFFSFAMFFAMIFSDAGYGLLLGIILILTWRNLSKTRASRRFRNLFLALVIATMGYGVLVGSYFGLSPDRGTWLDFCKVLDANDEGVMMLLSIVIGAAHLVLANLVTAWRYRHSARMLAPIGWAAMIVGGLITGVFRMGEDAAGPPFAIDYVLLVGGALAVLFFSSERPMPIKGIGDLAWRLLDGLQGLTNISKAFGDVLSYLRLFALGLASARLAVTFNEIAGTAGKLRGIGLLLAILILVVGHGLNFVLAVIGGVVHGLRLNCIEFFNWSLPEEGYPFRAFCKKANR
jgi:V/A-type H+-transporting ATPase subunit I